MKGRHIVPKKKNLTKAEKEELYNKNLPILKRILKRITNIVGIDLGTNLTGFYSLNLKDHAMSFGVALNGGNDHINKRIVKIIDAIDELLTRRTNTLVILEDYSFGLRGSSVSQLSELGGSVKTTLLRSNLGYLTLAPQTLKKFVLGPSRGKNTGKEFMLMQVLDRWQIKFDSSDVCDAYCLAQFVRELKFFINDERLYPKWVQEMFRDFIINRGLPIT
jgi:Holliday junction resolvasome RuvABC endonuclease subunit